MTSDRVEHSAQVWRAPRTMRPRRPRRPGDDGMTLIEVIVTLALTSIVMALATVIVINVLNETQGEAASIVGVQQAQLAERSFTQYLRSAVTLLSVQPNDITFTSYSGTSSGVPQLQTIEAQLCPTTAPYVDSLEVIYGLPQSPTTGWNGLHECIASNTPTPTTTPVPAGVRLVEAFDISPPAAGTNIFSYYSYSGTRFASLGSSVTASTPGIAAIGIDVTFLPPPGAVTRLYHTEFGTTLNTEIFLRNPSVSSTTTTTTTSS